MKLKRLGRTFLANVMDCYALLYRKRFRKLPNIRPVAYDPTKLPPKLSDEVMPYSENSSICESLYLEYGAATNMIRQDNQSLSSESIDLDLQAIPTHSMSGNTSDSNNSNTSDGSQHDYITDPRLEWSLMSNHCSVTSTDQVQNSENSMALFSKAEWSSILTKTQQDSGLGMDLYKTSGSGMTAP